MEFDDFECETKLFWDLYDLYGVLLAPGKAKCMEVSSRPFQPLNNLAGHCQPGGACGCEEAGWFRMHVAALPEHTLAAGFDRMERCLKAKQTLHGNW